MALVRLPSIGRVLAAALVAAALLAVAEPARADRVPARFLGVVAEPDLLAESALAPAGSSIEREMDAMAKAGTGSVRASFFWARTQPFETWADVPEGVRSHLTDVGGRPFDFRESDRIVRAAAARRLVVLPVLLWAPIWAGRHPGQFASPPADAAEFAAYAAVLVGRYGPEGSFWTENPGVPRVPIRDWQVWNEPSMTGFWLDQPWARRYVALIKATRPALRRVDPRARLVLAGLVYDSPKALRAIYKQGGRPHFDVAAAHPFTMRVSGVGRIVEAARVVMRQNGDARKPLFLTEISWPSAREKVPPLYGYEMSERGQAQRVTAALPYLAKRRRELGIERVYWYTWLTRDRDDTYPFDYAGLRRLEANRVVSKPALAAFRRGALALLGERR